MNSSHSAIFIGTVKEIGIGTKPGKQFGIKLIDDTLKSSIPENMRSHGQVYDVIATVDMLSRLSEREPPHMRQPIKVLLLI